MSLAHGIRVPGVLDGGHMGTSITLISALCAGVPVLLHDRSSEQTNKGLPLTEKLLEKDFSAGRIKSEEAKEARDRISAVDGMQDFRAVDMLVE
ncbi:hypothetical protein V5O48_011195 [Marasmius crinis-equi]|uniref:3-hydroxyacyl-CoA dehydrogenase NAD binding domain-containing protein n=1 Tax=Marasmius crinis-equi TaxID=585013 RepID=A0ABR3F6E9_9AGAR